MKESNKLDINKLEKITSLDKLWNHVEHITKQAYPNNNLQPILGNGKINHPKFMIVFINPTIRNISSNPQWKSIRYPFIGRKRPWKEFNKSNLIKDKEIMQHILENENNWDYEFTDKMKNYLAKQELYVTNIVKNTGHNADLPKADQINLYLPSFLKEIELIDPKYIITFGLIPFNALTKEKIKLKQYHEQVVETNKIQFYNIEINSKQYKVIPCFYPIGRGNPKLAIEMLKIIIELD